MQAPPPVVERCVSCRHPAHPGRRCGVATFFTGTCGCKLEPDEPVDFDERKAMREHDADWYNDPRDCLNCGETYRERDHVIVDRDPGLCLNCAVGG